MNRFVNLLENNAAHQVFDGTTVLEIPTSQLPDQDKDYSISFWIKWDGDGEKEWQQVYRKTLGTADGTSHSRMPAFFINKEHSKTHATAGTNLNWNHHDDGTDILKHRWYHITHVVSNTDKTMTVYTSDPSTGLTEEHEVSFGISRVLALDHGYFYVGGGTDSTSAGVIGNFIGVIADMRWYYDTALTRKNVHDISRQLKHTACCIGEESLAIDFQLEHGGCIELEECMISNYTVNADNIPTVINWNSINDISEPYTIDLDAIFEPLHTERYTTDTQYCVSGAEDPLLTDLSNRYESIHSGESIQFDTKYKLLNGLDLREVFTGWGLSSSLAYVIGTPSFTGYTDLGWKYTIDLDAGTVIPGGAKYKYDLATDPFMIDIIDSHTLDIFSPEYVHSNLTPFKRYYSRLSIIVPEEKDSISNITSAEANPCHDFHASRLDNSTVRVVTKPNVKVTMIEDKTSAQSIRGLVRPVADDEDGNLFIAIGEGRSLTETSSRGGRVVFDAGFLKFMSASGLTHSQSNKWSESYRTNIYTRPGQWAYMYNSFKYISRDTNVTNKMLLISEQHIANYTPLHFGPGVKGISEAYLNTTMTYLNDTTSGHLTVIKQSGRSSNEWRDYFKQFDYIAYFGTHYTSTVYLTSNFITGLLDYIDSGGGLFISTDHTSGTASFAKNINTVIKHYGVKFTSDIDRTTNHITYRISNILNNPVNIPGGWHPLFADMSSSSYIHAGGSEGVIVYDNTSGQTTSIVTDVNGIADFSTATLGKVIIRTSNDCGAIL